MSEAATPFFKIRWNPRRLKPATQEPLQSSYTGVVLNPLRTAAVVSSPQSTGVILAIDYGKKRLGLALSDEFGVTSRPYATWNRTNRRHDLARLRELVRRQRVCRIVVGLPLHMDGGPSEMSGEAKSFAARVERALGLPVEMVDERLSSWEARETLASMDSNHRSRRNLPGPSATNRKAPIDDVAAAIILRDYLNRARARAGSGA